jgi:hypothetical protein
MICSHLFYNLMFESENQVHSTVIATECCETMCLLPLVGLFERIGFMVLLA